MDGWEEGVPDGKPASSRALRLRPARLEQSEPGLVGGWGGGGSSGGGGQGGRQGGAVARSYNACRPDFAFHQYKLLIAFLGFQTLD